jgi:phosphoglycolate phosphatase
LIKSTLVRGSKEFLIWCKKNNISMAVCTNKQEHLAIDLLKKIEIYSYFEYVAGSDTFTYCKPDPRHLTSVIEIIGGDIKKTIMIGDSEIDEKSAQSSSIPFILLESGYTTVQSNQMKFDYLIKDFVGFENVIKKYL